MLKHFLHYRWFLVALIVGTILNLINQYELVFSADKSVQWPKVMMTYVVPYLVSSISAWYK
jgi:methyl-accepting chemotaxis protein